MRIGALHQQLPAVLRRRHDLGGDAPARARSARPRGVGRSRPRFPGAAEPTPRVVRYPSMPAATYPEFALAVPWSPRHQPAASRALQLDVFHAHHPFLLGPAARRLARRLGRPLVFTYHTRYEKYAHYVPLPRPLVEAAALRPQHALRGAAPTRSSRPRRSCATSCARAVSDAPIAVVPTGVDLDALPAGRPAGRAAQRSALPADERRSCSTSAASTARRAWTACCSPSSASPARSAARRLVAGRAGHGDGAAAAAWPAELAAGRSRALRRRAPARRRSPPGIRPPTSSCSPRRRRRRAWSWPRPPRAACRRWR